MRAASAPSFCRVQSIERQVHDIARDAQIDEPDALGFDGERSRPRRACNRAATPNRSRR